MARLGGRAGRVKVVDIVDKDFMTTIQQETLHRIRFYFQDSKRVKYPETVNRITEF